MKKKIDILQLSCNNVNLSNIIVRYNIDKSENKCNNTSNLNKLLIISASAIIQNNLIKQTIYVLLSEFFYIFLVANILYIKKSYNFLFFLLSEKKISTLQSSYNNIFLLTNNLFLLLYNFINCFTILFVGSVFLFKKTLNLLLLLK